MKKIQDILVIGLFVSVLTLGALVVKPQVTSAGEAGPGCEVDITLRAEPEDDTEFTFVPSQGDNFVLSDPSNNDKFIFVPQGGALMVTEIVPDGWALADIDCEGGGGEFNLTIIENGFSLDNCGGGEIQCDFENRLLIRPIPALSQWGLIAVAVAIGIVGIVFYSRRKATA